MVITLNTLKLFLNFDYNNEILIKTILNQLTYSGFEIDGITPINPCWNNLIIGKILDIKTVENSDKLKICTVFDGEKNLQIICGGSGLQINKNYILAPVGSQVGPLSIKERKVFGLLSQGMLCGWEEIGINLEGMTLVDDDFIPGTPLEKVYDMNFFQDVIYDIKITPNRYDCLSLMGLFREIIAQNPSITIKKNEIIHLKPTLDNKLNIEIKSPECRSFFTTIIKNVDNYSPLWLKVLIQNLGFKSINLPVDISNFLSLKYGYPTHCYGYNTIDNSSIETINTGKFLGLDNKEINLESECLVLKNQKEIQCLLGIMGGKNSSYDGNGSLILEVANFNPHIIRKTQKQYSINTKSSYLFSRWVDETQNLLVIQDFIHYLMNPYYFIHKKTNNIFISDSKNHSNYIFNYSSKEIFLSYENWFKIAGYGLSIEKQIQYLNQLKIPSHFHKIHKGDESNNYNIGLLASIPHWRHDITTPNNLVEEIIRMDNINQYNSQFISNEKFQKPGIDEKIWIYSTIISNILIHYNYQEIITNILTNQSVNDSVHILESSWCLKNSLIPDLIKGAQKAIDRGLKIFNLWEIGTVFNGKKGEINNVAGLIYNFYEEDNKIFYTARYHLEVLINYMNGSNKYLFFQDNDDGHEILNQKKSCKIYYKNKLMGYMGMVNRKDYDYPMALWEINLDILMDLLDNFTKNQGINLKNIDVSFFINGGNIHEIQKIIYRDLPVHNINIIDIYETNDNCSYTLNIQWKYDILEDGDNNKMMEKVSHLLKNNNCIVR